MKPPLIPMSVIKQHIRSDRDDEDDYLRMLLDAAICHCEDFTGIDFDVVSASSAIRQGLLLLIGHWYENRETVTDRAMSEAPAATYALWSPYKIYDLGVSCDQ